MYLSWEKETDRDGNRDRDRGSGRSPETWGQTVKKLLRDQFHSSLCNLFPYR